MKNKMNTVQFLGIQYIIENFKSQFNYHDLHINIKLFTNIRKLTNLSSMARGKI